MSDQQTDQPSVEAADPTFRRVLVILLPTLLAASVASLYWLHRRMLDLEYQALTSPSDAAEGVLSVATKSFVVLALVLAVVGSWFLVVAWKTLRSERFPPEGVPVARDTAIREGGPARVRGLVGMFLAFVILLTALALPTVGPQLLYDVFLPAFDRVE